MDEIKNDDALDAETTAIRDALDQVRGSFTRQDFRAMLKDVETLYAVVNDAIEDLGL